MKPRLLDLFCGAGGAAMGYHRAGFEVVGVDHKMQPNYPFGFWEADVFAVAPKLLKWYDFDAIHASPPCQAHSTASGVAVKAGAEFVDLIPETRELCRRSGLPYVIENVVGAPLESPIRLCGSSFGLDVRRHRLFESNVALLAVPCAHGWQTPRFRSLDSSSVEVGRLASVVGVHGHCQYAGEQPIREAAMDVDWMSPYELTQAIPPAYTEFIGRQLLEYVGAP